ncbi:MAG TPA: amidohydrolase [Candidatus Limnocylindrales bacterium]|nr:amidohydrolase [Candidatus Limnocylindrales bacterium]
MTNKILIKNGIVVTMDPQRRVIVDGAVAIEGNKIVAVGKTEELKNVLKDPVVIDAKHKAVMPGLINLHYHAHMLIRGLIANEAPTATLDELLYQFFYPLAIKMSPEEIYAEACLAYVESIKTGTTCVNDIYWRIVQLADAAKDTGIRAVISSEALDLAPSETIEDNEKGFLARNNSADGRVKIWFGIEWLPVCSTEMVMKARELANKYKTGIHVHLDESIWEVEQCKKKFGKRPIEQAYEDGILGEDCVAAHCVWVSDKEMKILAMTKTSVSHNPVSNMWFANGFARAPDMLASGINVGLGTDNPTNNADMFEVMKMASLVHKGNRQDISLMQAPQILTMATLNGAKALGMGKELGSIEKGKIADLILINTHTTRFEPLLLGKMSNLESHLVYAAHGECVDTSIIDGKIVMDNKKMVSIDEEKVMEKAKKALNSVKEKVF